MIELPIKLYRLIGTMPVECTFADVPDVSTRLCFDEIGRCVVSTVFLAVNIQPSEDPPVLFETMVLDEDGRQTFVRYSSHADALRGHREIVDGIKAIAESSEAPSPP